MPTGKHRGARRTEEERGKWDQKYSAGRMGDSRKAWAHLPKFDLIMFVGEVEEERQLFDPDTPPVRIEFRVPGKRTPTVVSLSHMTADELEVFAQFMEHAIKRARPICEILDQKAQEAYENGDDSYTRLYRPEPRFIDREISSEADDERSESEHGPSIQGGSEGAAPGDESPVNGTGISGD